MSKSLPPNVDLLATHKWPDGLEIRPFTADDLATIVSLEQAIFSDPWPSSTFDDLLTEEDWGGYVAVRAERIVGYTCYLIGFEELHLANLAVVPDERRKHVAHRLTDHILATARAYGLPTVLLEVRDSNHDARAFYERLGFTVLYRRPRYYHSPMEDALVMTIAVSSTDPELEG